MKRKYKVILSIIVLAATFLFGYFNWKTKKDELSEYGVETSAVLIKVEARGLKRRRIEAYYKFSDGLSLYSGKSRVRESFVNKHKLNDTLTIIYSKIDPTASKVKYPE